MGHSQGLFAATAGQVDSEDGSSAAKMLPFHANKLLIFTSGKNSSLNETGFSSDDKVESAAAAQYGHCLTEASRLIHSGDGSSARQVGGVLSPKLDFSSTNLNMLAGCTTLAKMDLRAVDH